MVSIVRERMQVALLGSWDPRWIEDHREWLRDGFHFDGWKNRLSRKKLDLLPERFHFYAYSPTSKGGSGWITYRLLCDSLEYSSERRSCGHKHRSHHDSKEMKFTLCFRIRRITPLKRPLAVSDFQTISGKRLKNGRSTLALPFVRGRRSVARSGGM
jgi:hypothetical protein